MNVKLALLATLLAALVLFAACSPPTKDVAPERSPEMSMVETKHDEHPSENQSAAPGIPASVKTEHEAIHATLVEATRASGKIGEAAQALAAVLHPHFVREEEIALPPLGLLEPLAMNRTIPESSADQALKMSDTLKAELPKMLEEHKAIRAAVLKLGEVAKAEGNAKFAQLADDLALHAKNEEEVMYPAAILVGELLRMRRAG
jgi:hypothetical protein